MDQGSSNNEHLIRQLKGAVFNYLDDGLVDELVCDLRSILKEEEEKLESMRSMYCRARRVLCGDDK